MGARNVGGAYLMWAHLADGPFRVLVGMALRSLDDDSTQTPARRWYGGEDDLVGFVRQTDTAGKVRTHATRRASAYRYLEQLRKAGAVRLVTPGRSGRRAVYDVLVDPLQGLTPSDPAVSDQIRPSGSDPVRPPVSDPVRPLGTTEEPQRNHDQENITFLNHSESRATPVDVDPESSWDLSEQYDAAYAHLKRTLGMTEAASRVATILATDPVRGYRAAVVELARTEGWGGP